MGTLKRDIENWDAVFGESLNIYRSMRSAPEAEKNKHGVRPILCEREVTFYVYLSS